MSVRHIHTQAQAQAELERQRAIKRASYIRRRQRRLNDTQPRPQAELQQNRAAKRASYARRKQRMLNDAEYHERELQKRKVKRNRKRTMIEEAVDARNDADRMAKVRKIARETQNTQDIQE